VKHAAPLQLDFVVQGSLVLVRLEGVLDEENKLGARTPSFSGRKLLFNLEKVHRINSCGARDWVRWIEGLEAEGNQLHFVRCSPAFIRHARQVRNFCGEKGHIVSLLAPYWCESCSAATNENVLAAMLGDLREAPWAICDGCGEPMDFDEPLESYRAIAERHAARPVDPDITQALNKFGDGHLVTAVAELQGLSMGRLWSGPKYTTPTPQSARVSHPATPPPPGEEAPRLMADEDKS
jgi:hypothetical protein